MAQFPSKLSYFALTTAPQKASSLGYRPDLITLRAMKKHKFEISINSTPEKVWNVLWDDSTYQQWTSVFSEGSHAKSDWEKGSKVLFLDEKNTGMVSTILDKIENQFMSFKHLGVVKDGVERFDTAETQGWAGATENYTLRSIDGKTHLTVEMDITADFEDYFLKTWPSAMEKVKQLSEMK